MKSRYLIVSTSNVARMVDEPDWSGDWPKRYGFRDYHYAQHWIDGWHGTIAYWSELSGPDGAHFFLLVPPEVVGNDPVNQAKHYLRGDHDVTGLTVIRLTWGDDLTKERYYRAHELGATDMWGLEREPSTKPATVPA